MSNTSVVAIIFGVGGGFIATMIVLVLALAVVLMCIKKAQGGYWQSKIVQQGTYIWVEFEREAPHYVHVVYEIFGMYVHISDSVFV